jgi:hypothetical protein
MPETPIKTRSVKTLAIVGRWLQVSRYDRVSSMLLALLCVVGFAAVLLSILWLTGRFSEPPRKALTPRIVTLGKEGVKDGDGRPAGGLPIDTPSNEPPTGKDSETADVKDNLTKMDVAAAAKVTELDSPEALFPTRQTTPGKNGGRGGPDGPGTGERGAPKPPIAPRHWEVIFTRNTLDGYAKQLDFFKIELAVLESNQKIIYARNLAKSKPDVREAANPAATEHRYYLTWRNGEMQNADRELLARAGIEAGDRLILKFLPAETEAQLVDLETRYSGADPKNIQRTRFGVQPDGDGFKFYVLEQSPKR